MNKGAKLALVILGLAAIVVPVILLIVFTSKVQKVPNVSTGTRPIDQSAVEKTVQKYPKPIASPTAASPSAIPKQASQSAQ